ncbi:hypothetical protein EJ05DRAFT_361539 [Pseudovirgaria hyperparasitica]|uniref:Uncharacterized protein n=1 Tax=Pseudovirgaria hyperparasitica TaxID=470096 RepID=A0A6A6W916_9PEZI|nr:uncharacterized protein EJ05DRAFT_361539 [Pseudovirgaria hyperparasitica]KAF2758689.1 hypothetical protein EJ05DRAFT_361539 [Pseudovirgaria hyperparasitica]
MGITLSTEPTPLTPLTLTTTTIGLLGFAFTLSTFFNVFWSAIHTFAHAPTQIQDLLGNLKQALYEERRHLREIRRRGRGRSGRWKGGPGTGRGTGRGRGTGTGRANSGFRGEKYDYDDHDGDWEVEDDTSTQTMRTTIRHLIAAFKALEAPFLEPGRAYYEDTSWAGVSGASRTESGAAAGGITAEREADWYTTPYRKCGVRERWVWVRRARKEAEGLMGALGRVQMRRVAREVGELFL